MTRYALSLRQPWADLVLEGRKSVETRTWNTNFRGEFFIHAAQAVDVEACKRFKRDPAMLVRGALVGSAKITGTKRYHTKEEFVAEDALHAAGWLPFSSDKPRYGFFLSEVKRVPTRACKGSLGFFKVER
jgi:hypothetical protein